MLRLIERRRNEARALFRALPLAEEIVALPRQRLDVSARRLAERGLAHAGPPSHRPRAIEPAPGAAIAACAARPRRRARLKALDQRLRRFRAGGRERPAAALRNLAARLANARLVQVRTERERISVCRHRIESLDGRMRLAARERLAARAARVQGLDQMLASLSYRSVLARGFALVRDAVDKPVRLAAEVVAGAALDIEFADGRVSAVAGAAAIEAKKTTTRKSDKNREQGSLF